MAQAAISDLENARFVDRQIELPGRPERAGGRFDLDVGEIRASGGDGRDRLHAEVQGYAFDLTVEAIKPPMIHYAGGDHDYVFGGDTRYYSRPLMRADGTVTTPDGEVHQVSGDLWFDRQWGELLPAVQNGWQWFAIQLSSNVQIMLYAFRDARQEWTGSLSLADGSVVPLAHNQFDIEVLDWWTSPHTGHRLPGGWKVTVPGESLIIRPKLADQEMTAGFWIGPRYWEGACSVAGTTSGSAYVELTGFGAGPALI
jgi:predicted secreted hydrolase